MCRVSAFRRDMRSEAAEGAVPAAGGVVVEVDTALEPERGDLVACSTADDCPSAPQIARIRRVDAEAGRCRCSRWTRP